MWRFSNELRADLTTIRLIPFTRQLAAWLVLTLCSSTVVISAGLSWEQTHRDLHVSGSAASVVEYAFRNDSHKPVTILGTKTSCGCTVGQPPHRTYASGETGILPVSHKPRPGIRTYRIEVRTDENGGKSYPLTLRVNNNPRVTVMPRVVTWTQGEERSSRTVVVHGKEDDLFKLVGIRADQDLFDFQVRDGQEPGTKNIVITPKSGVGSVPGRVRVQLRTEPQLPTTMGTQFFAVLR